MTLSFDIQKVPLRMLVKSHRKLFYRRSLPNTPKHEDDTVLRLQEELMRRGWYGKSNQERQTAKDSWAI